MPSVNQVFRTFHRLYVFPCLPAFSNDHRFSGFLFFRILHKWSVFPNFSPIIYFPALCSSCKLSRPFHRWHVFPRLALPPVSQVSTSLHTACSNHLHTKSNNIFSLNYIFTHSWSNLWNTRLIVSFNASSLLSSASTISASFSSISDVQYLLNPFFCDCRVYLSGILRTESGTSSW